jgi:signal transduction histidine kinase
VFRTLYARLRALPPLTGDIALAAALGVASVCFVLRGWGDDGGSGEVPPPPPFMAPHMVTAPGPTTADLVRDVLLNLLVCALLVGRRRWPRWCFALQFTILTAIDFTNTPASLAAVMAGAYTAVAYGASIVGSMSLLLGAGVVLATVNDDTWPRLPGRAGVFVILLPLGLLGIAIRTARERAHASEQRAEAREREQAAATRLAVAEERARIARELHDVVSHHVSVMTIQAGAAGKVLDDDPDLARGALGAIEAGGREAMSELRHLLGVLAPGPDDDLLHPQPGLDQIGSLVEKVRTAGLPVSVRRDDIALPHGVELTAYRVVQEALTNALRYAPGAPTSVAITAAPGELVVEVVNDAPPAVSAPHAGAGAGSGLVGLAERLRLYGGTLTAGLLPGGGFRVLARVPLSVLGVEAS